MYNVTATFEKEQVKLDSVFPIDMYCINASRSGYLPIYYANINQDIVGYSVNATGDVTASEVTYTGLPIKKNIMQTDIQGEIPELSITVPNTDRVVESLIHSYKYLRGHEVHIMLFYADNLATGSTADYIGVDPDYRSHIKEKFYIDSCTSNQEAVTFNLKSKFNIQNIVVPRRTFSRECQWALADKYAGTECDPESNIDTVTYPTCDGTLDSCRKRGNVSRYGGFPSVPSRGLIII